MEPIVLASGVTHPQTAWLITAVPIALSVAATLIVVVLLRARLIAALTGVAIRRAAVRRATLPTMLVPDEALIFNPPSVPPGRLLAICVAVALLLFLVGALVLPMFVALMLAGPLTALLVWVMVQYYEGRYVARLDRDLTAAMGRLSAALKGGNSYRQALDRLLSDMPAGPLREEWRFLIDRQGTPLLNVTGGGIATAQQVAAALAVQTPSPRHATMLNHLAVAVGQPQDVLAARVTAAYSALQASERRREEAVTELAQMRYSGMAVGLAGMVMALYLAVTQWDRVIVAYSGVLGAVVGSVVMSALLLPIIGGLLLARADDVDY